MSSSKKLQELVDCYYERKKARTAADKVYDEMDSKPEVHRLRIRYEELFTKWDIIDEDYAIKVHDFADANRLSIADV